MSKPYKYYLDPNKAAKTKTDYETIIKARTLLINDRDVDQGIKFSRSFMHKTSPISNYMQAYLCIICGFEVLGGRDKWRCCSDAYTFIAKEMYERRIHNLSDLDQEMMQVLYEGIKILHAMILRSKIHMGFGYAMEQLLEVEGKDEGEVDLGLGVEVAVHARLGLDLDYDLHDEDRGRTVLGRKLW